MRSLLLLLFSSAAIAQTVTLIRDVTVIDGGQVRAHMGVLIRGGRIAAVGSGLPAGGAAVVDGSGKFLVPGLIDAHVHLWHEEDLALYVKAGVTTVRDMGSDFERVKQWRAAILAGRREGPRIETSGPPVTGPDTKSTPEMPVVAVTTAPDGRRAAEELLDRRVDFIKVLSDVPRDAYFALAERARLFRFPFAGHVPDGITVWEAIDARQRSMEHLFGIAVACSAREAGLRQARALAVEKQDGAKLVEVAAAVLDSYSDERAGVLFDRMRTYGSVQVPTLVMLKRMMYIDPEKLVADERLERIPQKIRKSWDDPREQYRRFPEPVRAMLRRQYDRSVRITGAMYRAGVPMAAGTDTGDPYTIPGATLGDELALLVEAGVRPADALRLATIDAARVTGVDRTSGSIERGKFADLVLLDANPLDDIRNVARVRAVWFNGRAIRP